MIYIFNKNLIYQQMNLVQKFKKIIQIQKKRYSKKGPINTLIGVTLLLSTFFFAQRIGKSIWPENIENKVLFVLLTSMATHTLTQIYGLLCYLPAYLGWTNAYQNYEINKRSKWPWKRSDWPVILKNLFYNLLMNQLLTYPLMAYLAVSNQIKQRFDNFPSFFELLTQTLILFYVEDFFFYWAHKWSHDVKILYKLHKVHHEYDKVFVLATEYFHPADFIFFNMLPSVMGLVLIGKRAHIFTNFFWIFYRITMSTENHSGYQFPWSASRVLPMVFGPSYHDHHHSVNIGNYAGSCYFWDLMCGTGDLYMNQFLEKTKKK